jgi:hypothetical protein
LRFQVNKGAFDQVDLGKQLGVQQFTKEDSLSEKLGLPSSVTIESYSESVDRIALRIKDDFDVESGSFLTFMKDAYSKRPR